MKLEFKNNDLIELGEQPKFSNLVKNAKNRNQKDIIGKTFYCTSEFSKNLPFVVTQRYDDDSVSVDTWRGRSCTNNRPKGRIIGKVFLNENIYSMLDKGIISKTKV